MIQFWKNGGSLVLMAKNEPMTFQVNQFLEAVEFDGKKPEFRIDGDNPGGKILVDDKSGNLEKNCSFNSLIQKVNNVERESLAKNLKKLYEGLTVFYAKGKSLEPFIAFSNDSSGYINSLFYNGIDRGDGEDEGDIFIDCCYTKFFLEMNEKGTSVMEKIIMNNIKQKNLIIIIYLKMLIILILKLEIIKMENSITIKNLIKIKKYDYEKIKTKEEEQISNYNKDNNSNNKKNDKFIPFSFSSFQPKRLKFN
jgi:hypothetical protein